MDTTVSIYSPKIPIRPYVVREALIMSKISE